MPALGLGLGLPFVVPRGGEGISALDAWLSGATYADWDPSKLDRMFTTSVGPTNVASNGDAVGLLIGGSQLGGLTVPAYLAAAAEKVTNGGFVADTDWTKGSGWTIGSGVATHAAGVAGGLQQAASLTAGRLYYAVFDVSGRTAGTISVRLTGGSTISGPSLSSNGTFTCYLLAVSGNNTLRWDASSDFDGSIDNASLKEIPGYHALQSTSGDRPQYQSGYLRGDTLGDNLLTTYTWGAGANSIIFKAKPPASAAAAQYFIGSNTAGDARFAVGILGTGILYARIGDSTNHGATGVSAFSKTVVCGLSYPGSGDGKFYTYIDSVVAEFTFTPSGPPNTTVPARLLGLNNNGTVANSIGGDLGRTIAAQKTLSLAEFSAICPTF